MVRRALLLVALAALCAPLVFMIAGSFQPLRYAYVMPPRLVPETLDNYRVLLVGTPIGRWTTNTLIVVVLTVAGSVAMSAAGGYGFAVYRFRGRAALKTFLLVMIMIPGEVLVIPTFVMLRVTNLTNTYAAAVLPRMLSVLGVMLFDAYIRQIPRELVEAGRIAGAGELRIMTRLILPQCAPIAATIALFYGLGAAQDFLWQLITLSRSSNRTLIVGLVLQMRALINHTNAVGVSLAVGTIMFVPIAIIYALTARWFVRGLSLEGVKG